MRVQCRLGNIHGSGCLANVKLASGMLAGVRAVQVNREDLTAEVLYHSPATPYDLRERLALGRISRRRQMRELASNRPIARLPFGNEQKLRGGHSDWRKI